MQGNQYAVKIFEIVIEDEKELISFFDINHVLFLNRVILLRGEVSDEVRKYLKEKSLYFLENVDLPKKSVQNITLNNTHEEIEKIEKEIAEETQIKIDKIREESEEKNIVLMQALEEEKATRSQEKKKFESELSKLSLKLQNNMTVLDQMIRSGQELNIDGDLLLLNRVNSGATINIKGNLIITQIVEGSIRCDGNFMMLASSPKANIVFNGVEVDSSYLKDGLNRVELIDDQIVITPVLEKEINWAQS